MIFNPTVQGGKQEAPVISVSSSGLITATAGDQSATQQLPTQAARTITPSTSTQTAVASGRYTTGNVIVAGSANLVPANIKSGVNIFGVTGTFESGGGSCVGQMLASFKRGVRYTYMSPTGESKVSDAPVTDDVMIGSFLIVSYDTSTSTLYKSGGISYVGPANYGTTYGGDVEVYIVTGDFSLES